MLTLSTKTRTRQSAEDVMTDLDIRSQLPRLPVAAVALTLAHVATLYAVVGFRVRFDGSPLGDRGLATYACAAALSVAGVIYAYRCRDRKPTPTAVLLALTVPVLASLVFWLGLTGTYAPWDPFDSDVWTVILPVCALAFASIAVLYGSYRYVVVAQGALLALSLATGIASDFVYGLGNFVNSLERYGVWFVVGATSAAVTVIWLRRRSQSGVLEQVWASDAILGIVGSWLLYQWIVWLPNNGDYLGYVRTGLHVPDSGWGHLRWSAMWLAAAAGALAAMIGVFGVWRPWHRSVNLRDAKTDEMGAS
jgi:hypothetical protein